MNSRHIAGPARAESDAPDIFCPTVGCRLMADHKGCCGECDVCAQFGSHDAPIVSAWKFEEDGTISDDYIGKHRAYNPHKVYRGAMDKYMGVHRKYGWSMAEFKLWN